MFVFFLKVQEHPVWVPLWFAKLHGSPVPKDEEAETGRFALGQGATEADSSTDQRVVKETVADETDARQ
jgi:hypothetical protein